jgi:membrane protein
MLKKVKKALYMIYKAGDNAVEHDGIEHAGFLSFMGLLAIFPFLVFFVAILGVLGQTEMGTEFIQVIKDTAPPKIIAAILPRIEEILSGPPQALLTVSIVGTLWTSSSLIDGLRVSLNKAYHVYTPPNYWFRRAVSVVQILILVIILIFALFVLVFTPILYEAAYNFVTGFNHIANSVGAEKSQIDVSNNNLSHFTFEWRYLRIAGVLVAMILFISSLYYYLPNVKQNWLKTLPGAAIAAFGWLGIGRGLSYYLSNFNQVSVVYGSLGSVIAFLLFFYLINVVLIYGAEFNYLLEKSMGGEVMQKENVSKKDIRSTEKDNRRADKDIEKIET